MEMTLLVPFDLGGSYVVKILPGKCSECAWKNLFKTDFASDTVPDGWTWCTKGLGAEAKFREPFGHIACLKIRNDAGEEKPWIKQGVTDFIPGLQSIEAICFSRGVGVLVLRGSLGPSVDPTNWRTEFKAKRERLKDALTCIVQYAQCAYGRVMKRASELMQPHIGTVYPLDLPGRRTTGQPARFPYAVSFADKSTKKSPPLDYFKYQLALSQRTAGDWIALDVGWGEATVYSSLDPLNAQKEVESCFVAAMASWFSQVVMNSIVSLFLQESFIEMSTKRSKRWRKEDSQSGRLIRLAFLDAASASRPVRWTFREADILLLDHIYEKWSSERWWKSIEERTTLLAAHHGEAVAERRREAEGRLTLILVVLAVVTCITGIKDAADALKDHRYGVLAVALLIACCLIIWRILGSSRNRE